MTVKVQFDPPRFRLPEITAEAEPVPLCVTLAPGLRTPVPVVINAPPPTVRDESVCEFPFKSNTPFVLTVTLDVLESSLEPRSCTVPLLMARLPAMAVPEVFASRSVPALRVVVPEKLFAALPLRVSVPPEIVAMPRPACRRR